MECTTSFRIAAKNHKKEVAARRKGDQKKATSSCTAASTTVSKPTESNGRFPCKISVNNH